MLFLRNGKIVACYGLGEGHADSVFGSQDDHRARFDRLVGRQLKIIFSEQNAQNHEDLHHRVVTADTAPRSGSKGQKCEGPVQLLVRFGEALRIETLPGSPNTEANGARRV